MIGAVLCVLCLGTIPLYVTSRIIPEIKQMEWEKIVGGSKAENGSVPYQVSLRMSRAMPGVEGITHFCGASIISPYVILTAAHCVDGLKPDYYRAVVGTNHLLSGGQAYSIRKQVVHEEYNPRTIQFDIALVFPDSEIEFGPDVEPVKLNDAPVAPGTTLLLTGWGMSSYPVGASPDDLMQLDVVTVSTEVCRKALRGYGPIDETQICTISRYGQGACFGDSGGPLVREGRQVGVVSWGIPCGTGAPDVFTKVEAYLDWIETNIVNDIEEQGRFIDYKRKNRKLSNNLYL